MKYLELFENYDIDGYESHWMKFKNWLNQKDFDLYDGENDFYNKFMEVANNDNLDVETKASEIAFYLEDRWGLYDGFQEVIDYLEQLFMDEI